MVSSTESAEGIWQDSHYVSPSYDVVFVKDTLGWVVSSVNRPKSFSKAVYRVENGWTVEPKDIGEFLLPWEFLE